MTLDFIYVVKFIAAILITNSHMEGIYPVSGLTFGGAIGNALFFLVSGFCLSSKIKGKLSTWVLDRIIRIHVSVIMIVATLFLLNDLEPTIETVFLTIVFPLHFWFVAAIFVFYVVFYFVVKYFDSEIPKLLLINIAVYAAVYCLFIDTNKWVVESASFFRWIFYFFVMLSGYFIKQRFSTVCSVVANNSTHLFVFTALSFLGHLITRVLTIRYEAFMPFQFTVQMFSYLTACFMFFWLLSIEDWLGKMFSKSAVSSPIKIVANSTLEIYLVNMMCIRRVMHVVFPVNLLLGFLLVFLIGAMFQSISAKFQNVIRKICWYKKERS